MNVDGLCAAVREFEKVIHSGEQLCRRGDDATRILCIFYAMWSAFAVRAILESYSWNQIEVTTDGSRTEAPSLKDGSPLLGSDVVQAAGREFTNAVMSDNAEGIRTSLEHMGVFALCPYPEQQASRMALVAANSTPCVRLILLVDLSLLAIELGDYYRASKFATEAHSLNPTSWELYNLCVIEGQIALNAGNNREALQFLDKSMGACQWDEYASLACGTRVPNLSLVEMLLHGGERVEVVRHLLQCKNVWQSLSSQIDEWISVIEKGGTPDFRGTGVLKGSVKFSYRLKAQWMRACSLTSTEEPRSITPKSPEEVLAGRERLRAGYKRHQDAAARRQKDAL